VAAGGNPDLARQITIIPPGEGLVVLGAPIGPKQVVAHHWEGHVETNTAPLVEALATIGHLQSQFKLLEYCAVPRASFMLRVSDPDTIGPACAKHDETIRKGAASLLGEQVTATMRDVLSLPTRMGGVGLVRANDVKVPAFLASRAAAFKFGRLREQPLMRRVLGLPHPRTHDSVELRQRQRRRRRDS
jgi:hypothetical protein